MFVIKRDGRKEKVHFDKITSRIRKTSSSVSSWTRRSGGMPIRLQI